MKIFLKTKLRFFVRNHSPKRQIKYKVINFAPSNTLIMAIKLPSTNLERFLIRIKHLLMR